MISLLRKAADHLADAGYAVTEVEVPDLNKVWQLWCDLIMNEARVLQQEQMLATTSVDFRNAFEGFMALANRPRPGRLHEGHQRTIAPYPELDDVS